MVSGVLVEGSFRLWRKAPSGSEDDDDQQGAGSRIAISTSGESRVTNKRGRISGHDRAVDARDQSTVEMEDTDIE